MSNANAPVGVFDSGLGGLSVLREIQRLLPAEHMLYYGDSGHCPYGGRSPEYILGRSAAVTQYLVQRGAKIIVVACNTATSVCIPQLRARFRVPIVAMVPAVKPAAAATRSEKIGVLATPRTVTGESLAALIREHARDTEVYPVPAPGLVELVEAGCLSGPEVEDALRPLLEPLMARGVDTVVLGCTHYPFLGNVITDLAGPDLAIIDSGEAVARQTRHVLADRGLLRSGIGEGSLELFTSGEADHVSAVASRLLGKPVTVTHVDVQP
ncbi:MAG: glutamate racemase [Chloroflexia bacterium]|nr:glutamate racemase [Chloroflexia bacterium]